jgi:hypothetical protein
VQRILGLDVRRLRYWERLRLVAPQARWGERFYSFGDLVALRTIQRITELKIPARRLRRPSPPPAAVWSSLPLQELQFLDQGREVLVVPPGANGKPFNPIRQQWVFPFGVPKPAAKLHAMSSKTPEQWFDEALECEARVELLQQSVEGYRHARELAPDWIEAHINLGVVLYQMGQTNEARAAFQSPSSSIHRTEFRVTTSAASSKSRVTLMPPSNSSFKPHARYPRMPTFISIWHSHTKNAASTSPRANTGCSISATHPTAPGLSRLALT